MVLCYAGARPWGGPAGGHGPADGRPGAALPPTGERVSFASCGGVGLHLLHVPRDLLAAQNFVEGGAGAADSAQGRLGVLPSSFRSISGGATLAQVMGRSCTASQSDRESAGQGSADDEHVGPYVESVYRL